MWLFGPESDVNSPGLFPWAWVWWIPGQCQCHNFSDIICLSLSEFYPMKYSFIYLKKKERKKEG